MEELGLDFEGNEWNALDEEAEELTLRSLFHSTASESASGGWSAVYGGKVLAQDAILFLVDFRTSVAEGVDENGSKLLSSALRCAAEVMKDKIVARERDVVGVLGFGTKKTANPNSFGSISIVRDLAPPDASGIVELEKLASDANYLREKFGHRDSREMFHFHQALWTCRTLFAQSRSTAAGRSRRRVFVITDDEDPSKGSDTQKTQSAVQAKDLADAGAFVELICLKRAGARFRAGDAAFNLNRFYSEILLQDDHELGGHAVMVPASQLTDIRSQFRRKEHQQRLATTCTVSFGQSLVHLNGYVVCRKATRSTTTNLEAQSNEPTRSITSMWCSETAKTLHTRNLGYGYKFLDSMAMFSSQDLDSIKGATVEKNLTCIGFIQKSQIPQDLNLASALLYHPFTPDRSKLLKSGQAAAPRDKIFAAISAEMAKKSLAVLVIGSLLTRHQPVRFGAFILQEERLRDGMQITPPGWLLVWLPFEDDVRRDFVTHVACSTRITTDGEDQFTPDPNLCAAEEQVEAAMALVEKLSSSPFDPDQFSNPDIQQYYSGLQTLALGIDEVSDVVDTLQPDERRMQSVAGVELNHFLEALSIEDGFGVTMAVNERTSEQLAALEGRKRRAEEMMEEARTNLEKEGIDWYDRVQSDELHSLNVTVLKQYCIVHGLARSGNKKDLMQRVKDHIVTENRRNGR